MKYYERLTDEEYNALFRFLDRNDLLGEVLDLRTDVNLGDYFWDEEYLKIIPFTKALEEIVVENIYTDGVWFVRQNKEYRHLIENIFDKYCYNLKTKKHVKNVNKVLDKVEEI